MTLNKNQLPTPGGFPSKEVDPSELQMPSVSKDRLRRMAGNQPQVYAPPMSEADSTRK
jgi:hypothetical protein